jgi:hypothetical protein
VKGQVQCLEAGESTLHCFHKYQHIKRKAQHTNPKLAWTRCEAGLADFGPKLVQVGLWWRPCRLCRMFQSLIINFEAWLLNVICCFVRIIGPCSKLLRFGAQMCFEHPTSSMLMQFHGWLWYICVNTSIQSCKYKSPHLSYGSRWVTQQGLLLVEPKMTYFH